MKRLEYIGLKKDGERAFMERTGIEWMPGAQHDVAGEHAELMLKHSDVWREVPPEAVALARAGAPAERSADDAHAAALPEWAKKGIELGATDDQLEAIGQAGGPETEQGAELWKDATGTDWRPAVEAPPAAKKVPAKKVPAQKTVRRPTARKAGKRQA